MFRPLPLFLILLALYLLTMSGHLHSPDEGIMFRVAESLAHGEGLAIEPAEYAGFATRAPIPPRPDGREFAQYGIGQPLLAVPFYWLGVGLHAVASDAAWSSLGSRLRSPDTVVAPDDAVARSPESLAAHGRRTAHVLAISLFNPLVTAVSGVFLFLIAGRLTGSDFAAWLAALLWGAGSIAWPHASTFFSEPLAGLCLLLSLYCLARCFPPEAEAVRPRRWALATGIAAGYGCLVRADWPVFIPGLAIIVVWGNLATASAPSALTTRLLHHLRRPDTWLRLGLFLLPIALAGALVATLNLLHFGHPLASGYEDQAEGVRFATPLLVGLYGFLFSIGKGLFFFSPALVLAFAGIRPMLRRSPVFGVGVAVLFLSFLCTMSKWQNWAGGFDWGPRHIIQIHGLLAVPIAFWLAERWTAPRRMVVVAALLVGGAVQIYGASQSPFEFFHATFRDDDSPNAYVLLAPDEKMALQARYALIQRDPATGRPLPGSGVPLGYVLRAPKNDAIYIFQNSQWPGNAALWRERRVHDFFWLHLLTRE